MCCSRIFCLCSWFVEVFSLHSGNLSRIKHFSSNQMDTDNVSYFIDNYFDFQIRSGCISSRSIFSSQKWSFLQFVFERNSLVFLWKEFAVLFRKKFVRLISRRLPHLFSSLWRIFILFWIRNQFWCKKGKSERLLHGYHEK